MGEVEQSPDGSPLDGSLIEVILVPVASSGEKEQLAALAFTSVPLLVEAMGEHQPWVIIPTSEIEETLRGSGAQSVLIDPQVADGEEGSAHG
jgi:hypothetical protein